jgi:hypothetical protein
MNTEKQRPGFDLKMTGEEINTLPVAAYEGPVHVVRTEDALEKAVHALRGATTIRFLSSSLPAAGPPTSFSCGTCSHALPCSSSSPMSAL